MGWGILSFDFSRPFCGVNNCVPSEYSIGAWIRTVRQNQPIIWGDVYDPALAWHVIADLFKPRARLEAESLFLRHQSKMIIAVDVFSAMVTPM